jgi:hydrogen peroxide-dependent heme synthase
MASIGRNVAGDDWDDFGIGALEDPLEISVNAHSPCSRDLRTMDAAIMSSHRENYMAATTTHSVPHTASAETPAVPLTTEGYSVLHQMMRFRRSAWRALPQAERSAITQEAAAMLGEMEKATSGQSALYSLIGHKGDLLILHFRKSFADLNQAELKLANLCLSDYLEPTSSYLSIIELGLYDSTLKIYKELTDQGIQPHSDRWKAEIECKLDRHREAMHPRLFPDIPPNRYICFYPMDRRRGEEQNWYTLPIEERARQMNEHGLVGRRYAGEVKQIITGSIGFDDWEWGVDLFADDPLVFKKLIYEMRFDQVSAVYALFGQFYIGVRVPAAELGKLLSGELPPGS